MFRGTETEGLKSEIENSSLFCLFHCFHKNDKLCGKNQKRRLRKMYVCIVWEFSRFPSGRNASASFLDKKCSNFPVITRRGIFSWQSLWENGRHYYMKVSLQFNRSLCFDSVRRSVALSYCRIFGVMLQNALIPVFGRLYETVSYYNFGIFRVFQIPINRWQNLLNSGIFVKIPPPLSLAGALRWSSARTYFGFWESTVR